MAETLTDPQLYRDGSAPKVGDTVRLVEAGGLRTQMDEPAEPGEYLVADMSWSMLLLESDAAFIWCWPCRCELATNN